MRRFSRTSVSGMGVGCVVLVLALVTQLPSVSARPTLDTSGPLAFTGSVGDVDSLAGLTVAVSVEPSADRVAGLEPGTEVRQFIVPEAAVRTSGNRFAVVLDPASLPADRVARDGTVNFDVDVVHADGATRAASSTSVRRLSWAGHLLWADSLQHVASAPGRRGTDTFKAPRLTAGDAGLGPGAGVSEVRRRLGARLPELTMDLQPAPAASMRAPAGAGAGAGGVSEAVAAAAGAMCAYGSTRQRWATIGTSYPVGRHTSWLDYNSSAKSEFGVAVSVNKGGSWTGRGSRSLTDSWGKGFRPSSAIRSYRIKVEYRQVICYNSYGYESSRRWKPVSQPGYTWAYALSKRPNWRRHCGPDAPGTWYRGRVRGKDYTHSFGVQFKNVAGIDLSTRRAYSDDARLYYYSPVRRRLCGNNDAPAWASKIRERFKL